MFRICAYDRDGRQVAVVDAAGGEITIGREADRRLVLPSPSVSRRHARIVLDGPQPFVEDQGSANGVLVNGVRIGQPTALVPGTRVDIAEFRIEFGAAQPAYQPAPAYGAPAQGGYHVNGRETHGNTMIVDPWGKVLDCVASGEGIALADIDLALQAELRCRLPALSHRVFP